MDARTVTVLRKSYAIIHGKGPSGKHNDIIPLLFRVKLMITSVKLQHFVGSRLARFVTQLSFHIKHDIENLIKFLRVRLSMRMIYNRCQRGKFMYSERIIWVSMHH